MTDTAEEPFATWAILELMGHRRLAGYVTSVEIAGKGMLRIDCPVEDRTVTQFYSPAAMYALTPVSEDVARSVAKRNTPEPVHRWELPAAPEIEDAEVHDSPVECRACGDHLELSSELDEGICVNCR